MTLVECPRSSPGWQHKHHKGSASQHYCLLIIQIKDLSTEEPMGTKEFIPDLHYGKLNIQVAWHAIRDAVMERDREVCKMCGAKGSYGDELEVHHIIPRGEGGSHHPLNLLTLCKHCHHSRVHGGPKLLRVLPGEQATLGEF